VTVSARIQLEIGQAGFVTSVITRGVRIVVKWTRSCACVNVFQCGKVDIAALAVINSVVPKR